jgi:hypothetical protein
MKTKVRLFVLFCVIVLLPSKILAQRLKSDDILKKYESYQRPKSKFKLYKKNKIAEHKALKVLPIDTNAVYVSGMFDKYQNDTIYTYFRFFSNGEVFLSHEYISFPTEQEFNDLSYGKWGMYTVKEGELIMEIFVRGFPSVYWYNYAKIESEKLKFYKRIVGKWDKHTEFINFVKEKRQVNLTNFTINWK